MPEFDYCVNLQTDAGEMYSLLLPRRLEGSYQFPEDSMSSFLRIESREGQWYACCSAPAFFEDCEVSLSNSVRLGENRLYSIEAEFGSFKLHVIPITRDDLVYRNYFMVLNAEIRIGSSPNCEIRHAAPFCAPVHAVMRRDNGVWSIRDCGSEYGTYVNGNRISIDVSLRLGDHVFIAGMRMIVGTDFLSMSAGRDTFDVSKNVIREMPGSSYSRYSGQNITAAAQEFYNRMPRVPMTMKERTIGVEGPPMSMARSQMPLMLRMGSSVVMGGMSALAGNFTMLLSSVLFPFLSSKYTDEQKQKYEHLRNVKYREYLEMKRREIIAAQNDERDFLNKKYPSLMTMMEKVSKKENLWERRTTDSDFLHLRIGQGEQAMSTVIGYPQKSFELEPDELEEEMYRLTAKKYMLSDVPVILPLMEDRICSLTGDSDNARELLLHMVHQIAALHSYDEVKMMFLCGRNDVELLEVVRYLPHVWDDQKRIRFVAVEESEAFRLGEYLQAQLPEDMDSEKELKQILKNRPYYVIFALNRKLFESLEVLKRVMHSDHHHGISIVTSFDRLPKECKKIVTLPASGVYEAISLTEGGGGKVCFTGDYCSRQILEAARRTIANTQIRTMEDAEALPKMVTFLEMFRAGRIEHLNPLKRWQENNPVSSLAVPVGIGTDGMPFMLDLHEKHHGPHGLVAGMTGSGKSEFLITYILSLAINFHPDEVSFVLIDYKGGGLAGAFENPRTGVRLPHLVGTITNLDGNTIRRSLISLESELKRRQQEFNDVKSLINEGTMDIYDYQKLYRAGKIKKPMPHLFIISDEFAELKDQQPEFIDELISIARIGRSLGVHLILATQKPSGVVNEQIRSNTKFRACLRVQDRADSMDMLKRAEAAELTDTGRFYLQVGYNEYFALAQSAWCGAPYEPQEVIRPRRDDGIEVVDFTGQRIAKAKPRDARRNSGMRQLVAIVQFLSDLAQAQGILHDPLWETELPKQLDVDELQKKYPCGKNRISITLGKLDDPERQTQTDMTLDLTKCSNILIAGSPGSGKTTLLQTMLYSLIKHYTSEELQFYGLDYSSRLMKNMFGHLPHCGGILGEENTDDLDHFFQLVNSIVAERKKFFTKLGVDNYEDAVRIQKMPLILVFIDNFVGLGESRQGDIHSFRMPSYLKDCANYGVKYVITANRMNQVPAKLRLLLGERIALGQKDTYDYGDVLETKVTYVPAELPGRGLFAVEGRPLELQCAVFQADTDPEHPIESGTRQRLLTEVCRSIAQRYAGHTEARRIPVISENAEFTDFARQFARGRFPLGYDVMGKRAVALPFKQFSGLSIYLGNPDGTIPILRNIMISAEREQMTLWIACRNKDSLFQQREGGERVTLPVSAEVFAAGCDGTKLLNQKLLEQMNARVQIMQSYAQQSGGKLEPEAVREYLIRQVTPILILIESAADIASILDATTDVLMSRMLASAWKMGIYCVCMFEPEDYLRVRDGMFYRCFNADGNVLLLGGRYDQQQICDIPAEELVTKQMAFNSGIMQYRSKRYPVLIPCGEIKTAVTDADLESIF